MLVFIGLASQEPARQLELVYILLQISSKYKMCRQFLNHTHGSGQTDGPN